MLAPFIGQFVPFLESPCMRHPVLSGTARWKTTTMPACSRTTLLDPNQALAATNKEDLRHRVQRALPAAPRVPERVPRQAHARQAQRELLGARLPQALEVEVQKRAMPKKMRPEAAGREAPLVVEGSIATAGAKEKMARVAWMRG